MSERPLWQWGLLAALVLAALLAPLASSLPDGLEWASETLGFAEKAARPAVAAPMSDYRMPGIASERPGTALAGIAGTLIVFGVGWLIGRWLQARERRP
ncbi:MAG: PDGLE domain-containing protein [Armatimonadetes bacterium]|nr:PDGLE domain-containing protein [Armatimonadota bacterium]